MINEDDDRRDHNHSTTSTTMRVKASAMGYSCIFFCQRKTDDDVVEPRDTQPRPEPESKEELQAVGIAPVKLG